MEKKFTMADEARLHEKLGYLVTNSSRRVAIWLQHVNTGEVCTKDLPPEYWEEDYSRRCYEKARNEEGFEVAEVPNFPFFGTGMVGAAVIFRVSR